MHNLKALNDQRANKSFLGTTLESADKNLDESKAQQPVSDRKQLHQCRKWGGVWVLLLGHNSQSYGNRVGLNKRRNAHCKETHLQTPKISLSCSSFIDLLPTIVKLSTSKPFFGRRKFASVLSCLCNVWCVLMCVCVQKTILTRSTAGTAGRLTPCLQCPKVLRKYNCTACITPHKRVCFIFKAKMSITRIVFFNFFTELKRSINGTPTQHQGNGVWLTNHARYELEYTGNWMDF